MEMGVSWGGAEAEGGEGEKTDVGEEGGAVGGGGGEVHEVGDGFAGEEGFAVAGDDAVGDDSDAVGAAEAGEEERGVVEHDGKAKLPESEEKLCGFDATAPGFAREGEVVAVIVVADVEGDMGGIAAAADLPGVAAATGAVVVPGGEGVGGVGIDFGEAFVAAVGIGVVEVAGGEGVGVGVVVGAVAGGAEAVEVVGGHAGEARGGLGEVAGGLVGDGGGEGVELGGGEVLEEVRFFLGEDAPEVGAGDGSDAVARIDAGFDGGRVVAGFDEGGGFAGGVDGPLQELGQVDPFAGLMRVDLDDDAVVDADGSIVLVFSGGKEEPFFFAREVVKPP